MAERMKQSSTPQAPLPPHEDEQESAPGSWHLSSLELQEGLTVIDDYDTVPAGLFDF